MPRTSEQTEEWIPAMEAAKMLAYSFGGLKRAQEAIAIGLSEGLIRAGAEWGRESLEGEKPHEERSTADSFVEIEPEVWGKSAHWDGDRLSWDWDDGRFEIEGRDLEAVYSYVGVHFPVADIEAVDPKRYPYSRVVTADVETGRGGSQENMRSEASRYWDWDPAFADLVALAQFDGLEDPKHFGPLRRGFQGKLETWFANWFEARHNGAAPSEDQCRRRARQVVQALVRQRDESERTM